MAKLKMYNPVSGTKHSGNGNGHESKPPTSKQMDYLESLSPETYKRAREEEWSMEDVSSSIDALKNESSKPEDEPVEPLETFDLADLLTEDFPPLEWIIPDILPEGLTLFFSRPKIGKSMMVLMIALRMARRVTGGMDGKVLYLTLDDISKRRLQDRTRDLLQGQEIERDRVYCGTRAGKLDTGFMQELGMWMNGQPDTRLIIVDVYARIKPGRKDNDIFKGDYDALSQLQEFAVEHHCAIILVHHTRKQMDTQDWINNVNGSTGLTAAPDTIWTLRRPRNSYAMELQVTGRDTEDGTIRISLDDLDLPWEPKVEDEDTEYAVSGLESRILKALEQSDRALYPREVASATGASSVRMALRRMLKKKLIHQAMKSGPYSSVTMLQKSSGAAPQASLEQNSNTVTSEYTSQLLERSTAANAKSSTVDVDSMTRPQLNRIVKDSSQPFDVVKAASDRLVEMDDQKPKVVRQKRVNTKRKDHHEKAASS